MRRLTAALLACALSCGLLGSGAPARAASTGNNAPHTAKIVAQTPAAFTPNVMNGAVLTMAKVGNLIIVGGTFTTVRNAGSGTNITRRNVFAFDSTTGRVSGAFAPNPNGTVHKVLPGADGRSVYLGGEFTKITSARRVVKVGRLTKLSVASGARVTRFAPGSFDNSVRDLEVTGNRLWVAGKFSKVQGRKQRALGTVNATTGAYDRFFTGTFAGVHRPSLKFSTTSVLAISTDPRNSQLVAVGNFTSVNGAKRSQIVKLALTGTRATVANWNTRLYQSACSKRFESYVSDVSYAPNGRFFVVSTTGGYGGAGASLAGTSGCDVVARFEASHTGANVSPAWTAYTGGDTTWTIEVTDQVIYAGGHQRWQNNPTRGNTVGQGAVARTGIAALNPVNGMPYSWNPTRTRGVGIKDMLATDAGLYIGSDTNTFAGRSRYKVAFLPLAGGKTLAVPRSPSLPGELFRVTTGQGQLTRATFDGRSIISRTTPSPSALPWGSSVGAFMLNGTLYTAYRNGTFSKQTFDGATYGPATLVDTADRLSRQTDWHNTDVPTITSLFYAGGRIYFTRAGQNLLFSRAFEPESGVVGQQRRAASPVSGVNYASMRGAFVIGGTLYFGNTAGKLTIARWSETGPVAGTSRAQPDAGDAWGTRAMFVYQGATIAPPANTAPVAAPTAECVQLACSFNASESTDADGEISRYVWGFGDGTTGEGAVVSHTFDDPGERVVTLTVTDDAGKSGESSVRINPQS
jgi:hypothetical protein